VRDDGTVKVLDFGLATAMEPAGVMTPSQSMSPTITTPAMPFDDRSGQPGQGRGLTKAGLILGTAAYISPEQARGKVVDRRTDIWAFGCVLFEMLTGRPAYPGTDVTDILAAVVRAEPDWSGLPSDVGPRLRELIERRLTKDVRERKQSIGDVRRAPDLRTLSAAAERARPMSGMPEPPLDEWIAPEQTERGRDTADGQRSGAHEHVMGSHPCDRPAQEPRERGHRHRRSDTE
jgi:serine/threonine protein kinase